MCMPETAIDEERNAPAWQNKVGASGQPLSVETKSQAPRVEAASYDAFGLCVPVTDRRHIAAAGGFVVDVSQRRGGLAESPRTQLRYGVP